MIIRPFYLITLTSIIIFFSIFLIFFKNLNKDPEIKSNLLEREAPELFLEEMAGYNFPSNNDFYLKEYKLVNFWASWCAPCRVEHEILNKIQNKNFKIIGINYKDNENNAIKFLNELGNPYFSIGKDSSGKTAINWGIYGIPETFIINEKGKVILRHPGPITNEIYENKFKPILFKN